MRNVISTLSFKCRAIFYLFQIAELQNVIYVDGCVQPLQRAFEGHAVIIGAVIGAIIVPVVSHGV